MVTTPEDPPHGPAAIIALPEKLDTAAAKELHDDLLSMAGTDLALDASAVTTLGGRCLDLLLSARLRWTSDGHALTITSPSDALLRDLATFGASLTSITTGEAA